MDLPSVKLNIFKKLEYFQILKEFNRQFDIQFNLVINRHWKEKDQRYEGAYPSWEMEKKILFWSYMYHKHLKSGIGREQFSDMYISRKERLSVGIKKIFENLEMHGFRETKEKQENGDPVFFFNKEGLSFGELLWYLYKIKKYKRNASEKPKKYGEVYKTDYRLNRLSPGYFILQMQVLSLFLFMMYVAGILTFEVLSRIGLLDNLKNIFLGFFTQQNYQNYLLYIILLPFIIFLLSFILDFIYKFYWVDRRYQSIEKLK